MTQSALMNITPSSTSTLSTFTCGKTSAEVLIISMQRYGPVTITTDPLSHRSNWIRRRNVYTLPLPNIAWPLSCRCDRGSVAERRRTGRRWRPSHLTKWSIEVGFPFALLVVRILLVSIEMVFHGSAKVVQPNKCISSTTFLLLL